MADPTRPTSAGKSAGKKQADVSSKKAPAKKRRNWSHDETHALIAIWGSEEHQAGFEGMKYNSRVWAAIFAEFRARFPATPYTRWEAIKDRIEYLKKKYRVAKKENNASGRGRVTSPFYSDMDEILGRRPMNNVKAHHHMDAGLSSDEDDPTTTITAPSSADDVTEPDALDSSANTEEPDLSQDSDVDMLDEEDLIRSPTPPSSPEDDSISEPTPAEEDVPGPSSGTKRKQDKHEGSVLRKRRGKRSQIEDAMDKAMTKLVEFQQKQQSDSTGALLQLERDRFAWEQKQEEERDRRERQWKQDQLDLEDRKMQNNSQILMQFLSVLGKVGQGSNQSNNQVPAGRPNTQHVMSPIPPYVDHSSFGDEPATTFWQDTRRI